MVVGEMLWLLEVEVRKHTLLSRRGLAEEADLLSCIFISEAGFHLWGLAVWQRSFKKIAKP